MADNDEGDIKPSAPQQPDVDLSDETQDFRFLSTLSIAGEQPSLPRRGEKDFEPHGTASQQDALSSSRAAMHSALSHPRTHAPRYHIPAVYTPPSSSSSSSSSDGLTLVDRPQGQHFRTMGRADRGGKLWLLPEEALYLIERGNLDVRWPSEGSGGAHEGLPFSLQTAYAVFLGRRGLSLERYTVYAGLKRSGYIVQRAPAWDGGDDGDDECVPLRAAPAGHAWAWLYALLPAARVERPQPLGPLVGKGLYRSYNDIYRRLGIIPFHDPSSMPTTSRGSTVLETPASKEKAPTAGSPPPLRCSFDVWKPSPDFRKSSPDSPDFRIAVLNARETEVPPLEQLDGLLRSVPFDPPPARMENQTYQRLKHGYRNVILAIVDQGVVSYLRVADAAFGKERLYERSNRPRGGKGRAAARGRGRGRGR